jgi:glycerol uptake facilitator-like aquaporin
MAGGLARRLAAEAIGTAALIAGVVGSGIMAETLTEDIALALLANTIATGAILVVLITALGPISGAHFNPAVTLAMALRRRIGPGEALLFTLVQIMGGLLGVLAAHAMFEQDLFQASTKIRTGGAQWFAEGVATFGLVFFIFLVVRFRAEAAAWTVGLYITAAYWFTASTSFANPAVTIARAFTDTFSGIRPLDAPGFIAAQLGAAALAAGLAAWIAPEAEDSSS